MLFKAMVGSSSRSALGLRNNRKFARRLVAVLLAAVLMALGACNVPVPLGATATPTVPSPTAAPPTATPEPAVAIVNGERLTVREFQAQLAQYRAAQTSLARNVSDEDASKTVLEDLIAQALLAQGAKAAGFELSDSALQAKVDALQQRLGGADQLAKWESSNGYGSSETFRLALTRSLEAAWMRDKIVSAVPRTAEQVHVQQILLYNESDAGTVLAQLQAGTDFNALAALYDPNTRGELGWFPKGYLLEPAIEEAAFGLQAGEYSGVIHSGVGYHIIKVLERDPNHALSPDAYLALQENALKDWIASQRSSANIVLSPAP